MKKELDSESLYWASFNRFELRIPGEAINQICHSGSNDAAVKQWTPVIKLQVERDAFKNAPTDETIALELGEYGSWSDEDLQDHDANWQRLVWTAAWNICDEETPDCSEPVKPLTA